MAGQRGREHVVALLERGQHELPRPPRVGEAVEQEERLARAAAVGGGEHGRHGPSVVLDCGACSARIRPTSRTSRSRPTSRRRAILEARVSGASLAGQRRPGLGIVDCALDDCDLSNLHARGAELRRVAIDRSRATGLQLTEATLQDVLFARSRVDLAGISAAGLERVAFVSCHLGQADFQRTRFRSVHFEDCDLRHADFAWARFEDVEMRGCRLEGVRGVEAFRGVRMPWADVVEHAGLFAAACGVDVVD